MAGLLKMIQTLQEKKVKAEAHIAEQKKTVDEGSRQTVELYTLVEQIELYMVDHNMCQFNHTVCLQEQIGAKKTMLTTVASQQEYVRKCPALKCGDMYPTCAQYASAITRRNRNLKPYVDLHGNDLKQTNDLPGL